MNTPLPTVRDFEALERIKENIASADPAQFDHDMDAIQKKYPQIGNDLIEIELLSTIIKDLETALRIELFNILTDELQKLSKPSAAFSALNDVKRALLTLPTQSQKIVLEKMVSQKKGLQLDPELYQATLINLELLENK